MIKTNHIPLVFSQILPIFKKNGKIIPFSHIMDKITTISKLTEQLNTASPDELPRTMKSIAIPKEEFLEYASWLPNKYTRNCIKRTDKYEIILICWDKGAQTPIHDHNGQDCWMIQIDGLICETRYEEAKNGELVATNELNLCDGKLVYMHDRMGYHKLTNDLDQRGMTLHVYATPIDQCQVFDTEKNSFELKTMQYDTAVEEEIVS